MTKYYNLILAQAVREIEMSNSAAACGRITKGKSINPSVIADQLVKKEIEKITTLHETGKNNVSNY